MRYLSAEDILVIHARIIDATGGLHGVRDVHLIASMSGRPKMQFGGKDLYPSIFDRAAAYFESCAFHHAFLDGNKRTAIAIAARFLFLNGFELKTTNIILEKFVISAITRKYTLQKISLWFKKHAKRRPRNS